MFVDAQLSPILITLHLSVAGKCHDLQVEKIPDSIALRQTYRRLRRPYNDAANNFIWFNWIIPTESTILTKQPFNTQLLLTRSLSHINSLKTTSNSYHLHTKQCCLHTDGWLTGTASSPAQKKILSHHQRSSSGKGGRKEPMVNQKPPVYLDNGQPTDNKT